MPTLDPMYDVFFEEASVLFQSFKQAAKHAILVQSNPGSFSMTDARSARDALRAAGAALGAKFGGAIVIPPGSGQAPTIASFSAGEIISF